MPTSLPPNLHNYFWDINPAKLDPSRYPFYTAERLLELGDIASFRWLKDNFGEEFLIEVIKKSRGLSPRSANFYAYLFDIPRKDIKCFQMRSHLKLPWFSRN